MRQPRKASTVDQLKIHDRELQRFAWGLVQIWDPERDGDEYETHYDLGDGSVAYIRVFIDDATPHPMLKAVAYPVLPDGNPDLHRPRVIHKESIRTHTTERDNNR